MTFYTAVLRAVQKSKTCPESLISLYITLCTVMLGAVQTLQHAKTPFLMVALDQASLCYSFKHFVRLLNKSYSSLMLPHT